MLDTLWNDLHLASLQLGRMILHFNPEHAIEDEEEVIGFSVAVPLNL